jgi:hypothetical protein
VPRRLGEILREPVLLGAAGGGVLALWHLRERTRLGAIAGVLSIAAFCVLATAGLPIIGRYLLLPAAILAIFCGAGLAGWLLLERDHPWRRPWQAFAAVTVVAFAVFAPGQADRIDGLRDALRIQDRIQTDLKDAVSGLPRCEGISVPNHRPVPLLALWLDRDPSEISSPEQPRAGFGVHLAPATPQIAKDYVLDPRDPVQRIPRVPPGLRRANANRSWVVYLSGRCER